MKIYGVLRESFFKRKPRFMPGKLWSVVCNRANPRSAETMQKMFREKFPEGIFSGDKIPTGLAVEDRIVLLYPDSIGLGYFLTEAGLFFRHQVETLNGRRRHAHMTLGHWLLLLTKRFLEITFIPEIVFIPVLLAYALACAVYDGLKGRA